MSEEIRETIETKEEQAIEKPAVSENPKKEQNTNVIVAFILGLCSICICQICGPIGLYFTKKAKKEGCEESGMLAAALITNVIGTILLGLVVIAVIVLVICSMFAMSATTTDMFGY